MESVNISSLRPLPYKKPPEEVFIGISPEGLDQLRTVAGLMGRPATNDAMGEVLGFCVAGMLDLLTRLQSGPVTLEPRPTSGAGQPKHFGYEDE